MSTNRNNSVYHYCSLDTFIKIISNKTIRVSDISKSNDSEELKWIVNNACNIISDMILNNKEFCYKYKIDDSKANILKNQISRTISIRYSNNILSMISLACCFSEAEDLLSQWRGYANDGNGIAIGFNKSLLSTFETEAGIYHFNKIEYNSLKQKEYLLKYFSNIINSYLQINDDEIDDNSFFDFLQDLTLTTATLRNEAPLFKSNAFAEEREWRLYINAYFTNFVHNNYEQCENNSDNLGFAEEDFTMASNLLNGFIRNPVTFMARSNRITPYLDLNFNNVKNELINSVIIGPKCDVTEFDVKLLLASNGYDYDKITITNSKCTYR